MQQDLPPVREATSLSSGSGCLSFPRVLIEKPVKVCAYGRAMRVLVHRSYGNDNHPGMYAMRPSAFTAWEGAATRRKSMKELRSQDRWGLGKPSVLIFDVNETLIDFQSLNPLFEKTFGDKRVLREWLGHLILYSMTITMSGLYKDYWDIGRGVFRMVGGIRGVDVTEKDVEDLKTGMQTMPAWPDCKEGLAKLKEAGFRLVTLTNSPPPASGGRSPLEHAGIAGLFEKQFYIQSAKAYKPAQVVYHHVAQDLDVPPSDCCMVATHVWDTIGGQAAGMQSALITRPGNAVLPIDGLPQPNIVAKDTIDLAAKAAATWRADARRVA
jgi:2-haloacid dehalogenase